MWTFSLFDQTIMVAPYNMLNGIGLIAGLLSLDYYLGKDLPENRNTIYGLFVFSIISGWFGAHVLDWLVRDISFREAGFTFFGGLLSGGLFYLLCAGMYLTRKEIRLSLNCAVIPLVIGHAIGRTGCYFSGCCYGKCLHGTSPFATLFARHPTQLYEAGFLLCLAAFLHKCRDKYQTELITIYLFSYGTFRFFIEYLRDDDRGLFYGFSTSQWICMAFVLVTVMYYVSLRELHCLKQFAEPETGETFQ